MGYADINLLPHSSEVVAAVGSIGRWQARDRQTRDRPLDFDPSLKASCTPAPVGLEIIGPNSKYIFELLERGKLRLGEPAGVGVVHALAPIDSRHLESLRALFQRQRGRFALLVDRMDLAGCEYVVFKSAIKRYRAAGIEPDIAIPVISSSGEGLCLTADRIDWYSGPTLQHWLGGLSAQASS
ncbi:MAG: hypothetical protein ACKODB_06335 [Betaproteobacteria bacterium]